MRIRNSLLFLIVFLTGVIQSTALDYLSILGVKPDLLLVSVIFFTLYLGKGGGIKAAIIGGLFKDITSTAIFGSNAFAFCLCALFLSRFAGHFYREKVSTQILLCGLLYYIITFLILFINHGASKDPYIHLNTYHWMILKATLYTGSISPLLFFILSKVFRSVQYQKQYI